MSAQLLPEIVVGDPPGDHLALRVLGRLHPGADDFWDGNWLATPIKAAVGGFQATVGASLRADELQTFRDALKGLHSALNGEAVLESMEKWLTLRRFSWIAQPRGRLTAWTVVSSEPVARSGKWSLSLAFVPNARLESEADSAELFVGNVPGCDEAPPNYMEADDA